MPRRNAVCEGTIGCAARRSLKVLIIDDNEMMRMALRMTIQSDAYDVVGDASCAKTGIEQIDKLQPDIICLDVHMPNGNGLELLAQIKQTLPQTVVLMITSSNDAQTVQAAVRGGADGFIIKPFKAGTVLDVLQKSTAPLRARQGQPF